VYFKIKLSGTLDITKAIRAYEIFSVFSFIQGFD